MPASCKHISLLENLAQSTAFRSSLRFLPKYDCLLASRLAAICHAVQIPTVYHWYQETGITRCKHARHCLAGGVGLVAMMCARAFGADAVAITDIRPDNLALAERLGAHAALHLDPAHEPEEVSNGALARQDVRHV